MNLLGGSTLKAEVEKKPGEEVLAVAAVMVRGECASWARGEVTVTDLPADIG